MIFHDLTRQPDKRSTLRFIILFISIFLFTASKAQKASSASVIATKQTSTNSLGVELIRISPGTFMMGNEGEIDYHHLLKDEPHTPYLAKGDPNPYIKGGPVMQSNPLEWDETPSHQVNISRPFYLSSTPVTNAQYEAFRPDHKAMRGKSGFSTKDEDAVLYVSWNDAVAFCEWLSKKEGKSYRLPTEAEWEYAARAGTRTSYFTGDSLPSVYWQHQVMNRSHTLAPEKVDLAVGRVPANAWGLFNTHGLVEEWCADWYGFYKKDSQTDPTGAVNGITRVTRGGSHSTGLPFLRSANRSGALPETRTFLIGFRVVQADPLPPNPSTNVPKAVWATNVKQERYDWKANQRSNQQPIFEKPKTFTRIPPGANGPLYFIHNHEPALSVLPNGDLFAIWFTTTTERGREMVLAAARLRQGASEWDEPNLFFQIPDRNLTGQTLWWDGDSTIYHISGVGVADDWKNLALVLRKSTDNGVTWSAPEFIDPEFRSRHQPIDAMIKTSDGTLVFLSDATWAGEGGSAAHISKDGGRNWADPGRDQPKPDFSNGSTGHTIAGIHAGIVELNDGSWMALGRGNDIDGKMPMSISHDKGKTWQYTASPFTPIKSAQRLSLIRLKEGPILLISFEQEMVTSINNGNTVTGQGMYAALSFDEGKTWPVKKFITAGDEKQLLDAPCNWRWGPEFSLLDATHGEQRGYTTAEQAPDGMIHVLSSGTHYSFNLAWIKKPQASENSQ